MGISFASHVLFMGLGFLLDRWLKVSQPLRWWGLVGAFVSFVWVYKLRADERQYEADHPASTTARNEGGRLGRGAHRPGNGGAGALLGTRSSPPGPAFGAMSTAIEGVALTRLRRTWHERGTGPLKGFAEGMGLRLAGVAAWPPRL